MAKGAPVYAKMTFTHSRYREFAVRLAAAKRAALIEAGMIGRREARARYRRKYATGPGSTKATINYRTDGEHILMIYVGTLRGVFKEYGTKVREQRGKQEAQPYLRPGADAALASIIPNVRRLSPKRASL